MEEIITTFALGLMSILLGIALSLIVGAKPGVTK